MRPRSRRRYGGADQAGTHPCYKQRIPLVATKGLSATFFHGKTGRKFNISMYEDIFTERVQKRSRHATTVADVAPERVRALQDDSEFSFRNSSHKARHGKVV